MVEDGIYDEVHMGFMVAYGEFMWVYLGVDFWQSQQAKETNN
jgi:hypothetical protein